MNFKGTMGAFAIYTTLLFFEVAVVIDSEMPGCGRSNRLCVCNRTSNSALCNGRGKTFKYLPRLPSYIENVHLCGFHFPNFTNDTLASLKNLRRLVFLNIDNSTIANMSEDAFSVLSHFRGVILNISHNTVEERVLTRSFIGLQSVRLEYLDLRHLNISDRSGHFFDTLNGTRIKHICVSKNYLTKYNHSKFANVRSLTNLILSGNDIHEVYLQNSPELRSLKLAYNNIGEFLSICSNKDSMFPNLEILTLDHNYIEAVSGTQLKCLTKLKVLNLSRNKLFKFQTNSFSMLPRLESLSLRNMFGQIQRIEPFAFNNSNLKNLTLKDNRIDLQHDMDVGSLKGCDNLLRFDLSNNIIYKTLHMDDYMQELIGHLHQLQTLVLSQMILFSIPKVVTNLSNLRILSLSSNHIAELPKHFFNNLSNLTYLLMEKNAISVLREEDFPENVRQQLTAADFSGNPFVCDCQLLWFVQWLRNDKTKFLTGKYICYNSNQNLTTDWSVSVESCLLDYNTSMTVIVVLVLFILILTLASLGYRWRWHIKHYIYMLRYERNTHNYNNMKFSFDAFVIYCAGDANWVFDEAIPNLENTGNIKLCLHERDFIPGALIVDNIVDSLILSRKVILVLSNEFAGNQWCQFELNLCQTHVLEKGLDLLLVVMLEDIDGRLLTHSLIALLQTTTYIVWPTDDTEARQVFWSRLRTLLSSD